LPVADAGLLSGTDGSCLSTRLSLELVRYTMQYDSATRQLPASSESSERLFIRLS
jgi:hypothetical protein